MCMSHIPASPSPQWLSSSVALQVGCASLATCRALFLALARNCPLAVSPAGFTLRLPCLRLHVLSSGPLRTRLIPAAGMGPSGLVHGPQLNPIPAGLELTSLPPGRGDSSLRGTPLPKCDPGGRHGFQTAWFPLTDLQSARCPVTTGPKGSSHLQAPWHSVPLILAEPITRSHSLVLTPECKMVIFLREFVSKFENVRHTP